MFAKVPPVMELMGSNIVLQSGPGAGHHTKMSNQIVFAGNMLGVTEGLAYATAAGLDAENVLKSIGTGAAASFLLGALARLFSKGTSHPAS